MKKFFSSINKALNGFENVIIATGVLSATFIIFMNVVMRHLFKSPIMWAEELTRYIMMWVTFIGASLCVRDNIHVKMDLLHIKLPYKAAKILVCATYVVCILISAFLAYTGFTLTLKIAALGQVSSAMQMIPMWIVNLCVPISCVLMIKNYVYLLTLNILTRGEIVKRIGGEAE